MRCWDHGWIVLSKYFCCSSSALSGVNLWQIRICEWIWILDKCSCVLEFTLRIWKLRFFCLGSFRPYQHICSKFYHKISPQCCLFIFQRKKLVSCSEACVAAMNMLQSLYMHRHKTCFTLLTLGQQHVNGCLAKPRTAPKFFSRILGLVANFAFSVVNLT